MRMESISISPDSGRKKTAKTERVGLAIGAESAGLAKVWKKYFETNPPRPGSAAEREVLDLCERYTRATTFSGNESEGYQRDLHNKLGIMATGRPRSEMDSIDADLIRCFACEVYTGFPTLDELFKFRRDERGENTSGRD